MASMVPPKRGVAYTFYTSLTSQADVKLFQDSPSLSAGDVVIIKDGVLDGNIDTLPVAVTSATRVLAVTLSAAEMTADNVTVIFHDAAGAEWCDLVINIQTTARQVDDLAFPTTSGRSLDVTATGAAGVDWANVEGPTTTNNLSGTTVKAVTDAVTIGSLGAGSITAATIATGAIDADALAADAGAEIADAVWDEATAGHAGAGSYGAWVTGLVASITAALTAASAYLAAIAAAVWAYATRTLTTAAATGSTGTGTTLGSIVAGMTYTQTISGLTIPADWTKMRLTMKAHDTQTDAESIVQIVESSPGVGTDGLIYLNGAQGTAAQAALTVDQAGGTVAILIKAAATALLSQATLGYDLVCLSSTDTVAQLTAGAVSVGLTETKTIT